MFGSLLGGGGGGGGGGGLSSSAHANSANSNTFSNVFGGDNNTVPLIVLGVLTLIAIVFAFRK